MDKKLLNVKEILAKMTFEQKCMLLTGKNATTTPYEEFGVPSIKMMDGPVGLREYGGKNCVCFPSTALLASTWDRSAAFDTGKYTAREFLHNDFDVSLSPGVNMKRTPHGGRNFLLPFARGRGRVCTLRFQTAQNTPPLGFARSGRCRYCRQSKSGRGGERRIS